jgi:hypothetical protein
MSGDGGIVILFENLDLQVVVFRDVNQSIIEDQVVSHAERFEEFFYVFFAREIRITQVLEVFADVAVFRESFLDGL